MRRIIIPCWNYADYLSQTAQSWDLWGIVTVVTAPGDKDTIGLCRDLGLRCFLTDAWLKDGAKLNKAAALDAALETVPEGEVCITADADGRLEGKLPDEKFIAQDTIYGCWRKNTRGDIEPVANLPYIQKRGRGDAPESCGGYFQMFRRSVHRRYGSYPSAASCDYDFAFSFPKGVTLNTCFVVHLGTRRVNWEGRMA